MNGIKLGGFFISAGLQKTILVVFTVYSVAVIALGMLVHLKSRKTSRLCALIALNQNQLGQLLVILSAGGIALSFGVPYFFGVYSEDYSEKYTRI